MVRLSRSPLPGAGPIRAIVIALEVGNRDRFVEAGNLASYAGKVSHVGSSRGKARYSEVSPDVNHCLKWVFREAAKAIVSQQR